MVGCVRAVVGKKKFIIQFEDGQKEEMNYVSLSYVCPTEEVCLDIDEPISGLPKNNKVNC